MTEYISLYCTFSTYIFSLATSAPGASWISQKVGCAIWKICRGLCRHALFSPSSTLRGTAGIPQAILLASWTWKSENWWNGSPCLPTRRFVENLTAFSVFRVKNINIHNCVLIPHLKLNLGIYFQINLPSSRISAINHIKRALFDLFSINTSDFHFLFLHSDHKVSIR